MTITDIKNKYFRKIDLPDLEIIIAHALGRPREFVLAHPEFSINSKRLPTIDELAKRRAKEEPLAYILGRKEFFGLDFAVNKHTLIPRPETELLVETALIEIKKRKQKKIMVVDVGTGSGNIIVSIAKNNGEKETSNAEYYGTDISGNALRTAKYNAKKHSLNRRIKFSKGSLLNPIIKNKKLNFSRYSLIIIANLPYLSPKVYRSAPLTVRRYEPKSALLSADDGLAHYKKLFKQIKLLAAVHKSEIAGFFEIGSEQKPKIKKLAGFYFPAAKTSFRRDLAGCWRLAEIRL